MKPILAFLAFLFTSFSVFAQEADSLTLVDSAGPYQVLKHNYRFYWVRHTEDGNKHVFRLDTLVKNSFRKDGSDWTFADIYFINNQYLRLYTHNQEHVVIMGRAIGYGYINFMIWSDDGGMAWHMAEITNDALSKERTVRITGIGNQMSLEGLKFYDSEKGILVNFKYHFPTHFRCHLVYLTTEDGGRTWRKHSVKMPIGYYPVSRGTEVIEISDNGQIEMAIDMVTRKMYKEDRKRTFRLVSNDYGQTFDLIKN